MAAARSLSSKRERPHGPEVVLFCGGRDAMAATHWDLIHADIFGLRNGSVILHGGAKGVDLMADKIGRGLASSKRLHVARVDALWDAFGRKAGPWRNEAMLMLNPTFAFCYPTGGPGTAGMLELLRNAGIDHVIREVPVHA